MACALFSVLVLLGKRKVLFLTLSVRHSGHFEGFVLPLRDSDSEDRQDTDLGISVPTEAQQQCINHSSFVLHLNSVEAHL